ncbi:MAG: UDP-3-O-(3-hydroxymyristoyl)glucosamine N-acyltransferase [Candidatus Omnitrophica bacterium]|nr:UDP-3-O-(3-hydroxymyristoyl)glucosamine N-acyltransferase [Candidatus Omnitrophota bacterium]
MRKTLAEIANIVGGKVVGDVKVVVTALSGIKEAKEGDLTLLENPKYLDSALKTAASAIIVAKDTLLPGKNLIQTENPSLAFSKVISLFEDLRSFCPKGISKKTDIDQSAKIDKGASVGAFSVIGKNARVGKDTVVFSNCNIGAQVNIGDNCLIYPNVTIREKTFIGDNVIIHSGTVIGSDGYGYTQADSAHHKIPQIGTVEIQDNVEIGANVAIDRARINKTVIGRGTKIDNLVHIAHNVILGESCLIIAQVGISGSVNVGKGAILAGQVGVAGHISIGDGAICAAQAGVTKSVPAKTTVSGYPAQDHEQAKKINAHIQRLPKYVEMIKSLEERVKELERELKNKNG